MRAGSRRSGVRHRDHSGARRYCFASAAGFIARGVGREDGLVGAALPPQTFTFGLQATPVKAAATGCGMGGDSRQLDYGSLCFLPIEQA